MIWIVLTVVFYITSGLFFAGFNRELYSRFDGIGWDYFDIFVWTIAWLPIVWIMFALMAHSKIQEWLHG